jgi:hypothetical protein
MAILYIAISIIFTNAEWALGLCVPHAARRRRIISIGRESRTNQAISGFLSQRYFMAYGMLTANHSAMCLEIQMERDITLGSYSTVYPILTNGVISLEIRTEI